MVIFLVLLVGVCVAVVFQREHAKQVGQKVGRAKAKAMLMY